MLAKLRRDLPAKLTVTPAVLVALIVFVGCLLWTVYISFTGSRLLPNYEWAAFAQYERLFATARWQIAYSNMFIFGVLFIGICLVLGFLLAVAIDQNIRAEGVFRTVFLYPLSMSFVVTGLAWQWFLNPTLGLQAVVRDLGFEDFVFDWLVRGDRAIYTLVIAGVWQASGLVMAIMLAGLRGIDREIWRATRIDGVHPARVYWHIVLPMLRPMVLTAVVLLAIAVVKSYDLVVAMTRGGPGNASDLPARFVIDHTFERANLGLAAAGAVVMLVTMAAAVVPYLYTEMRRRER